jgi:hypothetical protein
MLSWLRVVTIAATVTFSMGVAAQDQYQEGVHYDLIEPAIHTGYQRSGGGYRVFLLRLRPLL